MAAPDEKTLKKNNILHTIFSKDSPLVSATLAVGGALTSTAVAAQDITTQDEFGNLPLQALLAKKHVAPPDESEINLIKKYLEKGINVNHQNDNGDTALHIACRRFHDVTEIIDLLISYGADVNICNSNKQTPLRCAIMVKNEKRVNDLLHRGSIVMPEDIIAAKDNTNIKKMLQDPPLLLTDADFMPLLEAFKTFKSGSSFVRLAPKNQNFVKAVPTLIHTIQYLQQENENLRKLLAQANAWHGKVKTKPKKISTEALLSKSDWDLLLTVAEIQYYSYNTKIIYRGMCSKYLYVVKKGSVRVEKDKRVLATIGETELFGEMSLVDRYGFSSAAVIANSESVELYAIEAPFIYKLLLSDSSNLAYRFFRYIAMILSLRLKSWTPPTKENEKEKEKKDKKEKKERKLPTISIASAVNPIGLSDNQDVPKPDRIKRRPPSVTFSSQGSIFEIGRGSHAKTTDDVPKELSQAPKPYSDASGKVFGIAILKECPCSFKKGGIKYNGKMTITKYTVLLEAKLFAHKVKEYIDFDNIQSINHKEKNKVQIIANDKRQISLYPKNAAEIIVVLEGICRTRKEKTNLSTARGLTTIIFTANALNTAVEPPITGVEIRMPSDLFNQQQAFRLTEGDWDEILKGAKSTTYKRNEVLLEAGKFYNNIYQISKGLCRIEKDTPSGKVQLGAMHADEVFGEIGFLERTEASASVVAESDRVDVCSIEGRYLDLLFRENAALGARFYFYLCTLLGERLQRRHRLFNENEREISIKDIVEQPLYLELPTFKIDPKSKHSKCQKVIEGPSETQDNDPLHITEENLYKDIVCARTISTYYFDDTLNRRLGDPICDQYYVSVYRRQIIAALADGCNWGVSVREAAHKASSAFVQYIERYCDMLTDIQSAGELIVRAFSIAHNAILDGKDPLSTPVGTTTLLGGTLVELVDHPTSVWGFVFGSVGDCKVFLFSPQKKQLIDLTQNSRQELDPTDCGGRLGPYIDGLLPDLRNFRLGFMECQPNDLLFIVSDGVHDNLDAVQLGVEPSKFGINVKDWHDVKTPQEKAQVDDALDRYRNELLTEIIGDNTSCAAITSALLSHCLGVNEKATEWMKQNPGKKLPFNYKDYPGKMDHTSCICIRVPQRTKVDVTRSCAPDFSINIAGITNSASAGSVGSAGSSPRGRQLSPPTISPRSRSRSPSPTHAPPPYVPHASASSPPS